jgi:hypothetical protein
VASVSFNGYGHFDIDELARGAAPPAGRRVRPAGAIGPEEKYGAPPGASPPDPGLDRLPFCGLTLVSCERGVIRQSESGLYVYTDEGREEIPVANGAGPAAGLIEMREALRARRAPFPDGRWARRTLEACRAILDSSREAREIVLEPEP